MDIRYVPKKKLYPKFGFNWPDKALVHIREDLPTVVQDFVCAHEVYHLTDKATWWVWREIKANLYAAWRCPLGFIICTLMSLAPYRLKYYWQRILKEK